MLIRRQHFVFILALFLMNLFEMGVVKSFGVFLADIAFQLDTDYAQLGIIIGMYHGVTFFIAPFITPIVKGMRVRVLAIICVIGSLSFSSLCLTTNVVQFSILSLLSGICYAFVRLAGVLKFCKNVKDHFALAYGIADSGSAIGMIVIPIFAEFLLEVYNWRGTILILGGLLLHNAIFLFVMDGHRKGDAEENGYSVVEEDKCEAIDAESEDAVIDQLELTRSESENNLIDKVPSNLPNAFCTYVGKCFRYLSDTYKFSLLEMGWTWVIVFYQLVAGMVNTTWIVFLVPHGVAKGLPLSKAVPLAVFGGLGNVMGRLCQGIVIDRGWMTSLDLTIVLTAVNAIVFLLDPWIHVFWLLGLAAFLGGLTIGARTTVSVVLLRDLFPTVFSALYGLTCLFYSIGEPLGGLLAGWLSNVASLSIAFLVLGGIEVLTCLVLIPSRCFLGERTDA